MARTPPGSHGQPGSSPAGGSGRRASLPQSPRSAMGRGPVAAPSPATSQVPGAGPGQIPESTPPEPETKSDITERTDPESPSYSHIPAQAQPNRQFWDASARPVEAPGSTPRRYPIAEKQSESDFVLIAFLEKQLRRVQLYITPSQGVVLFFGVLSLFFAALSSYFFWQNRHNETRVRNFQDQLRVLKEQAGIADSEAHKAAVEELASAQRASGPGTTLPVPPVDSTAPGVVDVPGSSEEETIRKRERELLDAQRNANHAEQQQPQQPPPPASSPSTISSGDAAAPVPVRDWTAVRELFSAFASGEDIRLVTRDGQPGLRMAFPFLYNQGEIILRPQARLFLARLGKDSAPLLATHQIRVEGFTRTKVSAHFSPALDLAFGRAAAVTRQMVEDGNVPPTRITTTIRGDTSAEGPVPRQAPERIEIYLDPATAISVPTPSPGTDSSQPGTSAAPTSILPIPTLAPAPAPPSGSAPDKPPLPTSLQPPPSTPTPSGDNPGAGTPPASGDSSAVPDSEPPTAAPSIQPSGDSSPTRRQPQLRSPDSSNAPPLPPRAPQGSAFPDDAAYRVCPAFWTMT